MTDVVYTVEQLNPRGRTSKAMEMAIRRSQALGSIIRSIFDQTGGDLEATKRTGPLASGSVTATELKMVFGDPVYAHPFRPFPRMVGMGSRLLV